MELIMDKTDKSVIFGVRSVPERKVNSTIILFFSENYFVFSYGFKNSMKLF